MSDVPYGGTDARLCCVARELSGLKMLTWRLFSQLLLATVGECAALTLCPDTPMADDDLYGGYNDFDTGLTDKDYDDEEFQRALKTAAGQRPALKTAMRPTTGTRGASGTGQPGSKPTTAQRAPGTALRGKTGLNAARLATGVAPIVWIGEYRYLRVI